jgi:hypothetical protein
MNNNVNNPRSIAQDAAGWYFSNLDPHISNESNIHRYLRTPVVALTVKIFQHSKTAPQSTAVAGVEDVEEEKKSFNGNEKISGDWRDFLQDGNGSAIKKGDRKLLQQQYASLTRRTKARMEAFLAACSLAVPGPNEEESSSKAASRINEVESSAMISLQDGLSGFGIGSSPSKTSDRAFPVRAPSLTEKMGRSVMGKIPDPNLANHPQIAHDDLVVRLELYIRTIHRVRNLNEECVIAMEPPKSIRVRARCITYAFVATAAYVRNITPVLTRLLHCLTMEMLAVECVAGEITKVVHRVASEYEHRTSFASLAFLSTPEVNADSLLMPLILKYLNYLSADWERLVRECELERMLARAVDPSLRRLFKTIEFQSIGHLLETCHKFRANLQNIELPPNVCAVAENVSSLCNNPEAVRQALRDLQREIITVNGHVLPPVTSRKELINLLTQTLNSRTLTSAPYKKRKNARAKKLHRPASAPNLAHSDTELSSDVAPSPDKRRRPAVPPGSPSGGIVSDMSENDLPGFESSSACDSPPEANEKKHRRRRSKFHLSTIDVLTRRLLIAASRTGNGGDAYFFV